jgi:ribosomal S6-like protein
MSYDIQHFREASYFLLHFDIAPSAIRDLERGMLISEEILRHLVTVLVDHGAAMSEDDIPPAAVPADDEADGQAPARTARAEEGAEPVEAEADAEAQQPEAEEAEAEDAAGDAPESDESGQTEEAETAVEA